MKYRKLNFIGYEVRRLEVREVTSLISIVHKFIKLKQVRPENLKTYKPENLQLELRKS